ncbi:MAG: hypothetical protein LBG50_04070 [Clostridiales Family XIII bacterium]|jgi:hypothetical protein|nr:hypothetical protein [Clostridiales Family XIII bacterium]
MKNVIAVLILIIAALLFQGCARDGAENDVIAFAPTTCSLEYKAGDSLEKGALELTFYCGSNCFIKDSSKIESVELVNDSYTVPAKVDKIDISEVPVAQIDGRDIFLGTLGIGFDRTNHELLDAGILITRTDGTQIERYIGDYSFAVNNRAVGERDALFAMVSKGVIGSEPDEANRDRLKMTGLIIQAEAETKLKITDIDFGISTVGINPKEIRVFDADTYNSQIKPRLDEGKLGEVIENAYNIQTGEAASACDIDIPSGEQWIYVPFEVKSESAPPIFQTAVNLTYEAGGKSMSYAIPATHLFGQAFHDEDEILGFFNEDAGSGSEG